MTISANIYAQSFNQHNKSNDPNIKQQIAQLQETDSKVRAHEMAHQAAGGGLAGAPHYTLKKGPDGKDYAVAGEVPIKIEQSNDPKKTIEDMQQVKAAALAPADPSPQDIKVAQNADMIAAKAEIKLQQEKLQLNHIDVYA